MFAILSDKIVWKNILDKNKLNSLEEIHVQLWKNKLKDLSKTETFYDMLYLKNTFNDSLEIIL